VEEELFKPALLFIDQCGGTSTISNENDECHGLLSSWHSPFSGFSPQKSIDRACLGIQIHPQSLFVEA